MKITIERTNLVVNAYGVPMHVWEGKTEAGIRIACLVDQFMIESEDRDRFEDTDAKSKDLAPSPSVIAAFPAKIVRAAKPKAETAPHVRGKAARQGRR